MEYNEDDEKLIEKFLIILYERSPSREPPFITREEIANEMDISETQKNNIVGELFDRGYVTKGEIVGTKIRITEEGRQHVREILD